MWKRRKWGIKAVICLMMIGIVSCEKLLPPAPEDDSILDGPVAGLTSSQSLQFSRGDQVFNDLVFTGATGLGPVFVTNSCGSCHAGDGKGHPFTTLTRFGQIDSNGNQYLHSGGPQLQNRALPGYVPEQIPAGATFSKFTPPAVTGLGFLHYVPDSELMAMADPNDTDGDGISGTVNWIRVPAYITLRPDAIAQGERKIGRFGKKASAYDLLMQSVEAFNQDMGIASFYNPVDVWSGQVINPEVSLQSMHDLVFYLKTLKAPIQRNAADPEVMSGKNLFLQIDCGNCHVPSLKTGQSPIEPLSNKDFFPYTDLLLHDMGPGLDDGYTEGTATTGEWRTPPLWGLGLSPNSQGGQYFLMHDGRAHSIEEAILMHGGEGSNSRTGYLNLSETEKSALVKFLESL